MLYYDITYILLIPAIILTFWAQIRVKSQFAKFSRVRVSTGYTGAQAAYEVLRRNGLERIQIGYTAGSLTDHYDPRTGIVNLSETVYGADTVAAVAVACHECGHAIQHARGYKPLEIRNTIVPLVNLTSTLSWPVAIIGIMLLGAGNYNLGDTVFNVGIIMFCVVVAFHLITLPVELNASKRALEQMLDLGIVTQDERRGAKKVLTAAAMTYMAALATAIANLLRLLAMRNRNR